MPAPSPPPVYAANDDGARAPSPSRHRGPTTPSSRMLQQQLVTPKRNQGRRSSKLAPLTTASPPAPSRPQTDPSEEPRKIGRLRFGQPMRQLRQVGAPAARNSPGFGPQPPQQQQQQQLMLSPTRAVKAAEPAVAVAPAPAPAPSPALSPPPSAKPKAVGALRARIARQRTQATATDAPEGAHLAPAPQSSSPSTQQPQPRAGGAAAPARTTEAAFTRGIALMNAALEARRPSDRPPQEQYKANGGLGGTATFQALLPAGAGDGRQRTLQHVEELPVLCITDGAAMCLVDFNGSQRHRNHGAAAAAAAPAPAFWFSAARVEEGRRAGAGAVRLALADCLASTATGGAALPTPGRALPPLSLQYGAEPLLLVLPPSPAVAEALDDLAGSYQPRMLHAAYPDGVRVRGRWCGGAAAPLFAAAVEGAAPQAGGADMGALYPALSAAQAQERGRRAHGTLVLPQAVWEEILATARQHRPQHGAGSGGAAAAASTASPDRRAAPSAPFQGVGHRLGRGPKPAPAAPHPTRAAAAAAAVATAEGPTAQAVTPLSNQPSYTLPLRCTGAAAAAAGRRCEAVHVHTHIGLLVLQREGAGDGAGRAATAGDVKRAIAGSAVGRRLGLSTGSGDGAEVRAFDLVYAPRTAPLADGVALDGRRVTLRLVRHAE